MAIIKMIKNPPKNKRSLKAAINYVKQPAKTRPDLVGGHNCDWERAYNDFIETKALFDKENGIQAKHMVMSFDVNDDVSVELAKQLADELLQNKVFDGFQVLYAVHQDKDHIHTHFLINSVNMETGKRWHQTAVDLQNIKIHSNELCRQHGLSEIEFNKNEGVLSDAEYRNRFESWKYELYLTTVNAARRSVDKDDFKNLMNRLGYDVSWEDDKKYITFTTPDGQKCRNRKLYPQYKFTKEALERQFSENLHLHNSDELKMMQDSFTEKINGVESKYPISHLVEQEETKEFEDVSYQDWYDANRDYLIDDDKYDTYKSLGYAMKHSVSMNDFITRLNNMGMDLDIGDNSDVSVFISKQGIEYDNTELYEGHKYTPSALKECFEKNNFIRQFKDTFWKSIKEAMSMNGFKTLLSDNGYSYDYTDGEYIFKDADGAEIKSDTFGRDFESIFERNVISKFLLYHKWSSDSLQEFLDTVASDGCEINVNDGVISYSFDGQEYQDDSFNVDELNDYFDMKLDKKELKSILWQVRFCATSREDFIDKMGQLGYKVDWQDDGQITYRTPSGRSFDTNDLDVDEFEADALEEQFEKNELDDRFDMLCNFLRVFRSHDPAPVSSAMKVHPDLSGEKLREFMYHFERGSASRYNKNLNNDFSM